MSLTRAAGPGRRCVLRKTSKLKAETTSEHFVQGHQNEKIIYKKDKICKFFCLQSSDFSVHGPQHYHEILAALKGGRNHEKKRP